ncbi:MAG: ABC transporter ATP-binding protein [Bacteroidia bacterium]|nr:ABC transporter ATP-binding protein [Bacteroidia bacterium]
MSGEYILEVKNLSTEFRTREGTVSAVKKVSFNLSPGKTLGIVGESGSGKSVTALSVMKLLPDYAHIPEGEIWFSPEKGTQTNLLTTPNPEMQRIRGNKISMIFQEPMTSLNPVFSCGEQVSEVLRIHQHLSRPEAHRRTLELFDQVELPRKEELYFSYPHQISGGQKQRVMIAMAMSCNPSILIADEPTTALDVTVQKNILRLMEQLQAHYGMAIIFITHDLGVVGEIADDILVMYRGEAVEYGQVETIFQHPQHLYTQGLLSCRPTAHVHRLPTVEDFMEKRPLSSEPKSRNKTLQQQAPALVVEGLTKHYSSSKGWFSSPKTVVKAVDDVSFVVYPGETVGLVGESGCGKTTLGRAILRLIDPSKGKVLFQGKELTSLNSSELRPLRKDMQIIFQDPYSSLNPRIPIGEAIMEPMAVHGIGKNSRERREKTEQLLEKVQLSAAFFNRYPHQFSGGQRQRVCIARALAVDPGFIICDESVSALDVSVQAQILNLLKDLQEERNLTYIFISHDLSVIRFMSDRILVMQQGKIVEEGYAEELYENPQNPYTQKLIDAVPAGTPEAIRVAIERRRLGK